jgi:hypothetical protein
MPGTDTKATSHWASTRRPVACYQDGCWIVDPSAVHEALSRVRRFVDYTHTSWTTWEAAHGRENPRRNSWGFRMRSETIAEATQRLEMISASANRLHAGRRQGQAPREAPAPAPDPAPPAPQPKQSGPPPPAAQAPKRRAHASRQLALFPT